MEHQPYSSDLTSSDFWLFPKIKSTLMGRKFQDIEYIQKKKNCEDVIENYSTTGVPKYFHQWQHRWANCIVAEGVYFEDDPCLYASILEYSRKKNHYGDFIAKPLLGLSVGTGL
jgi:hypothetical protein